MKPSPFTNKKKAARSVKNCRRLGAHWDTGGGQVTAGQHGTARAKQRSISGGAHIETRFSHICLAEWLSCCAYVISSKSHLDFEVKEPMLLYNVNKRRKSFWRGKYMENKKISSLFSCNLFVRYHNKLFHY
jgi:hypothetical protein